MWGKINNALIKPFAKSIEQGAATTVYCAAHPGAEHVRPFKG